MSNNIRHSPSSSPSSSSAADLPSLQVVHGIIPNDILYAPIRSIVPPPPPPSKKKRKTKNDEFTIMERLQILSELGSCPQQGGSTTPPTPTTTTNPDAATTTITTITQLASKHHISRASIYRWKKDLPRLLQLSKGKDGRKKIMTHAKKRVPTISKKNNTKLVVLQQHNHMKQKRKNFQRGQRQRRSTTNTATVAAAATTTTTTTTNMTTSTTRPSFHEEFSASQKLDAIRQLSSTVMNNDANQYPISTTSSGPTTITIGGTTANSFTANKSTTSTTTNSSSTTTTTANSIHHIQPPPPPPPSVRTVAAKMGANYRSVYRWKKEEEILVRMVEKEGKGHCKRNIQDPIHRIKVALKVYYENYSSSNNNNGRTFTIPTTATTTMTATSSSSETDVSSSSSPPPPPPLTGTILAWKARQIRDELLRQHYEIQSYLSEKEVKGIQEFTGSLSWGRKILKMFQTTTSTTATTTTTTSTTTTTDPTSPPPAATTAAAAAAAAAETKITIPPCHDARKWNEEEQQQKIQEIQELKLELTMVKKQLQESVSRIHQLEMENGILRKKHTADNNNKNNNDILPLV